MFKLKPLVGVMSLIWLSMGVAQAEEESVKDKPAEIKPVQAEALDMVSVVGSVEDAKDMPASASYIGTEDIRDQSYSDINRILRKAPGVNIREEDGFGLFPNISFRGVDTTRSAKITVMEDGVLVAPAAYSAPAAYFNPAGGRMSGVEVLKGGSQVMYGPHITGGVMNYLSTPIPVEGKAYLKAIYGSYGEFRSHGFVGDTIDTAHGKVGYLVEGFYRGSDGFKTIDTTADFQNGDQTGFQQVEPMLRLSWEPNTAMYQKLEVKFGYSSMDADETYLGLTEEDFRNDPYRRYAASRFDNIDTQQVGGFARYFVSPTDNLDIVTTAYYKEFDRNWSKLDGDRWARALAGENAADLACLKGTAACNNLTVRDNNRSYYAGGVDTSAKYRFDLGITHHELNGGFRYHEDAETRFQHDTTYTQNASGVITNQVVGAPGSQDNRTGETQAYAFFLKDRIELGKFGFTPGMRYEHLYQTYDDRRPVSRMKADSSLDIYSGGGSVDYKFTDDFMMFASAHRGFSPPNPESAIVNNFKEETSNAYELGGKYSHGAFSTELTGFYTQFDNLLVVNNIGGGGGPAENFGSVESRGVELAMNFDAGEAFDWGFRNPYFLSFTYTNAEQTSNARSSNSESIFSYGREGNKVPYIPEYALSFGSGLHFQKWGIEVAANYVSSTFTSANNTEEQLDGNNPARKDSRFGKTDEYVIMDVSTYYKVAKGIKILGGVQNASNEEYVVSRQPYGPRPGMPLFAYGGFELDFDI